MGPQGSTADRIADLELQVRVLVRNSNAQGQPQAPSMGLILKNAISVLPPDASPGDTFEPTARPWIIFVDAADPDVAEDKRREKPVVRAQTRDGSKIDAADEKLIAYFYGGRWWVVPTAGKVELIYLGNPDSSDAYVEPDDSGAYDARLYTIESIASKAVSETKAWLLVGQCFDEHDNVTPLPRGLVLLASKQGTHTVGEGEEADERPLYYADHWQWLWCKLDLSAEETLADGADGQAKVLDKDGTETSLTISVRNRTGVSIPADAKIFADYHAESGLWWIRFYASNTILRAKVDDTLTTTGNVYLWDTLTNDYSVDTTTLTNRCRTLFAEEEITVGLNTAGEWVPLEVPQHLFDGTADEAIAKGASGDVILQDLPTTPTIMATSRHGAVASGDLVTVAWIGGEWRIIAAECPEAP